MVDSIESRPGIRIHQLRLSGAIGRRPEYPVNFCDDDGVVRALAVIAGPSQTGKTSIIDFIRYCLGGADVPQHPEIVAAVRAASLEVELEGSVYTIERSASGTESRFASIWPCSFEDLRSPVLGEGDIVETRRTTESPGDPEGLSQFVLSACGLDGIGLPEAPTQDESRTQILSIRDLFHVVWLPNERLDSKNLVFEHSNYMVAQKFRQTVDAIFDVHDSTASSLAAELRSVNDAARQAARDADRLREVVQIEHPSGEVVLESDRERLRTEIGTLSSRLRLLDGEQRSEQQYVQLLRQQLLDAQQSAREASIRVRDRESLLKRLAALRGQYADDKKKLTFLKEAEQLFDPLRVTTCPACLTGLESEPATVDGACSLCGSEVHSHLPADIDSSSNEPSQGELDYQGRTSVRLIDAELRSTTLRLDDLIGYWNRLDRDLSRLKDQEQAEALSVNAASAALDRITTVPAPFLAFRDELNRQLTEVRLSLQNAEAGLRMWGRVRTAEERADRLRRQAEQLRRERREATNRPSREAVVRNLSERFNRILGEFGYPKLSQAWIDDKYIPHLRGMNYSAASSGGQTLITLAFYLSVLEVSYETSSRGSGLLMIDSPQKNLGHSANEEDPDFADSRLVENFYRHVKGWLASEGQGAQVIVVDNSPPDSVANDVVVRFTRDPARAPYGLIDDAVD